MNDIKKNLPIYIRIVEGAKDAILNGQFPEGSQIPSTTNISKLYKINVATVNKAFNVLVSEGLIYKKRGIGMFVSEGATQKLIAERKAAFKDNYVKATLIEAKRLNIDIPDLQKIVEETYSEMNS
ncbi:MAG: GntR family transcriptional regulator [Bacilli bacterium]|nr:GntR family transcriptional regulator [Bacilli bacterium]